MKQGVFFSLTVVLFFIFASIFLGATQTVQTRSNDLYLERTQLLVMDHYVNDYQNSYIPAILHSAAKPALIEAITNPAVTPPLSHADFIDIMEDGVIGTTPVPSLLSTDTNLEQALASVTFPINKDDALSYKLDSASQPDTEITLIFKVNYELEAFDSTWERSDMDVKVIFDSSNLFVVVPSGSCHIAELIQDPLVTVTC